MRPHAYTTNRNLVPCSVTTDKPQQNKGVSNIHKYQQFGQIQFLAPVSIVTRRHDSCCCASPFINTSDDFSTVMKHEKNVKIFMRTSDKSPQNM